MLPHAAFRRYFAIFRHAAFISSFFSFADTFRFSFHFFFHAAALLMMPLCLHAAAFIFFAPYMPLSYDYYAMMPRHFSRCYAPLLSPFSLFDIAAIAFSMDTICHFADVFFACCRFRA